jgi:hypothetical protein
MLSEVAGCRVADVYVSPHAITESDDQVDKTGKPSKLDHSAVRGDFCSPLTGKHEEGRKDVCRQYSKVLYGR